ncbi:hypothetical protein FGO68_gene16394 [Halteria grandinella]|uniref:Cyclic nucleotide-binding domain-containing protein n=1 Tax=Halteria grandinella TaxID=5974 RepID=A0A8J8P2K4_HALGN|nr:hypothetical protein FGO68_gene16394 [Halteria grandinella]
MQANQDNEQEHSSAYHSYYRSAVNVNRHRSIDISTVGKNAIIKSPAVVTKHLLNPEEEDEDEDDFPTHALHKLGEKPPRQYKHSMFIQQPTTKLSPTNNTNPPISKHSLMKRSLLHGLLARQPLLMPTVEEVLWILNHHQPNVRSREENQRISLFFEKLPIFQNMRKDMRSYQDGEVICNYGDIGEEFYIVIQGEVSIHSPKSIEVSLPSAFDALSLLFLGPPQTLLELQLQQLDMRSSSSVSQSTVQTPATNIQASQTPVEIPQSTGGASVPLTLTQIIPDKDYRALLELCQTYRAIMPHKAATQLKAKKHNVGLQGLAAGTISSLGINNNNRARQHSNIDQSSNDTVNIHGGNNNNNTSDNDYGYPQRMESSSHLLSSSLHLKPTVALSPLSHADLEELDKQQQKLLTPTLMQLLYLQESMRITSGHAFGELALMHRGKAIKRAATAVSVGQTHIAILGRNDFQRVCLTQLERSSEELIDFLQTFRICQGINRQTLSQLNYYLKQRQYRRGMHLFREGQPSTGIFFIIDGDFEVTKRMVRKEPKDEQLNNETINGFKESRDLSSQRQSSKSAFSMNRCNQIMRDQNVRKIGVNNKVDVRVSIIGVSQVVGMEDMSKDDTVFEGRHQSTVTCISDRGSAFFVSREDFFGFLYRYINKSHLSEQFEAKLPFYNRRVERVMSVQKSLKTITGMMAKNDSEILRKRGISYQPPQKETIELHKSYDEKRVTTTNKFIDDSTAMMLDNKISQISLTRYVQQKPSDQTIVELQKNILVPVLSQMKGEGVKSLSPHRGENQSLSEKGQLVYQPQFSTFTSRKLSNCGITSEVKSKADLKTPSPVKRVEIRRDDTTSTKHESHQNNFHIYQKNHQVREALSGSPPLRKAGQQQLQKKVLVPQENGKGSQTVMSQTIIIKGKQRHHYDTAVKIIRVGSPFKLQQMNKFKKHLTSNLCEGIQGLAIKSKEGCESSFFDQYSNQTKADTVSHLELRLAQYKLVQEQLSPKGMSDFQLTKYPIVPAVAETFLEEDDDDEELEDIISPCKGTILKSKQETYYRTGAPSNISHTMRSTQLRPNLVGMQSTLDDNLNWASDTFSLTKDAGFATKNYSAKCTFVDFSSHFLQPSIIGHHFAPAQQPHKTMKGTSCPPPPPKVGKHHKSESQVVITPFNHVSEAPPIFHHTKKLSFEQIRYHLKKSSERVIGAVLGVQHGQKQVFDRIIHPVQWPKLKL